MAKKLSVDLELNAQGYTQGINEAKNATAQYTNATRDIKKEQEEYLAQFGSLKKQLGAAKKEAYNLAAAFSQLSDTEKQSEVGQQMADDLQIAIEKAAELQDVMADTSDAIKNAASDTAGLDALKESMEVGKNIATAYAGAVAKLTGDEKALKDVVATLAMVQGGFNAVIKTTNMLQKNSATMIALQRSGVLSLAQAEKISTAATKAATVATKGLGMAMKALPYVGVAVGVLAIGKAFVNYMSGANKAVKETKNVEEELTGVKKTLNDVANSFNGSYAQALGKTLGTYKQLQNQYKALSSEHEKVKWIKENSDKMKELGLSVTGVNDADRILIKQSKDVIESFKLRAQAAAEAARLQDLYVKRIEAETEARKRANKKQIKAGESVAAGDVDRFGLQEGIDYTQYKHKVGMFYTDAGAMKAQQALAANNIRTYTAEIDKEIEASANRLAKAEEEYDKALGNLGMGGSGGSGGSSSSGGSKVVDKMLPPMTKVDAQINKWFKDFDKKIAEKNKELSKKQAADSDNAKALLNSNIGIQQAQNQIQNALTIKPEIDFSSLPDSLQKAANDAVKQLDNITNAMVIADKAKQEFLKNGDMSGVQAMNEELESLTKQYKKQADAIEEYAKRAEQVKNLSTAFENVGNTVGQLGSLFSALGDATDDAGLKVIGIIAETLATMALSFSKALMSCTTWWEWLAFGITGMIQLVSMVAQIKQLTAGGYAEGGIIPGSNFHGDKVMAMVNSGEMILNTRQQKNLFDILDGVTGAGISSNKIQVTGVIKGKDLLLVQKNYNTLGAKSGQSIKIS